MVGSLVTVVVRAGGRRHFASGLGCPAGRLAPSLDVRRHFRVFVGDGAVELFLSDVGVCQVGALQVSSLQARACQTSLRQERPVQTGSRQVRAFQVGSE